MLHLLSSTPEAESFLDEWLNGSQYIVAHTSGSTGAPKPIRLSKEDMKRSARATNMRFGIDSTSVLFCPLSVGYIAGKMMVVRALEAGCRLLLEDPSNRPLSASSLQILAAAVDCNAIDLAAIVPSQIESLATNESARQLLRNVIIGGAPISSAQEHLLLEAPWKSYASYGMTETCSHVALRAIGSDTYTAMPGITFQVDNRQCLIINASEFSFRSLTTNDIVEPISTTRPDGDGPFTAFRWLGRFDNVINSGGVKFNPETLESLLAPHIPTPFFITSIPDDKWGAVPVLVVETSQIIPGNDADSDMIAKLCRQLLPRYATPKRIIFSKAIHRSPTGKLLRHL